MSFFQKIIKPSYDLNVIYDNEHDLYHYKLTIFDNANNSNANNNIDGLSKDFFEGSAKENPVSAFWHYNESNLPSIIFSS